MNLRPTTPSLPQGTSSEAAADDVADGLGARVHIDVTIPRTSIRGRMRLLGRAETFAVTAEARQALAAGGFPVDATAATALGANENWQYELIARTLAIAVRNPRDEARALASVDDWRDCDDDQLAALYQEYKDHATRIDPLGAGAAQLTEEQVVFLRAAAKKKDSDLLISFGSRRLASFICISDDPPASSATPTS